MSGVSTGIDETVLVNGRPVSYGQITPKWFQYGYDNKNTGYNPESSAVTEGVIDWSISASPNHNNYSHPAASDGYLWVAADNELQARNPSDGSKEWGVALAGDIDGDITVDNGLVYVGSYDDSNYIGHTYAIDIESQSIKWDYSAATEENRKNTIVTEDSVFFGGDGGNVYAVAKSDGTEKWTANINDFGDIWVAHDGNNLYVNGNDAKSIIAFNPNDGSIVWEYTGTPDWTSTAPAVADGKVLVGGRNSHFYAVNASDGSETWIKNPGNGIGGSPAIYDNKVYFGDGGGNAYALNIGDGSTVWTTGSLGGSAGIDSPTTAAGGAVYMGGANGMLYALDASDGSIRWSVDLGDYVDLAPMITNGIAYIKVPKTDDPDFYAIK